MEIPKPTSISSNPIKSQKWDELTRGRNFKESDIPTLELLCQWHAIVERCERDMSWNDDIQVAYENKIGDIKALPQIGMIKQASAEIRALNKQLGISDEVATSEPKRKETMLYVIQKRRDEAQAYRKPRAANKKGA